MMQFNMYHHYTVDEHLIRTVGVLSEIETRRARRHPLSTDIFPTIENRRALYLAMLPARHRQGTGGDHSDRRRRIARSSCPRLGLTAAETETDRLARTSSI